MSGTTGLSGFASGSSEGVGFGLGSQSKGGIADALQQFEQILSQLEQMFENGSGQNGSPANADTGGFGGNGGGAGAEGPSSMGGGAGSPASLGGDQGLSGLGSELSELGQKLQALGLQQELSQVSSELNQMGQSSQPAGLAGMQNKTTVL